MIHQSGGLLPTVSADDVASAGREPPPATWPAPTNRIRGHLASSDFIRAVF
jgi:hypothetical protein